MNIYASTKKPHPASGSFPPALDWHHRHIRSLFSEGINKPNFSANNMRLIAAAGFWLTAV